MPIYEYVCTGCGNRFEAFQKANDSALQKCRKCGGRLKKVLSPPALQFKGSGWYITDYARKPSSEKSEEKPQARTAAAESGSDKGSAEKEKTSKSEE